MNIFNNIYHHAEDPNNLISDINRITMGHPFNEVQKIMRYQKTGINEKWLKLHKNGC